MPMISVAGEPNTAPVRIMVVEDETLVRLAIAMELRSKGAVVVEATTGDEAWDYLTTQAPVDLIFTDYQMPGSLNGAQLAKRVLATFPGLPVLITSARVTAPDDWSADILSKPYDLAGTAGALIALARGAENTP